MKYFLQTIRFSPNTPQALGLRKIDDNTYILEEDMSKWGYCKLLDLGWGKEHGFFRMPLLTFDRLLQHVFDFDDEKLKIVTDEVYNFYGALSVLSQNYASCFIQEIIRRVTEGKLNTNKNKFLINYLNSEFNIDDQLIQRLSNKDMVESCILWKIAYGKIVATNKDGN